MSDNGNVREIMKEVKAEVVSESVQAATVPLSPQERIDRVQQAIQAALSEYGCVFETTWLQISPTQQVRSEGVTIVALADWKAAE